MDRHSGQPPSTARHQQGPVALWNRKSFVRAQEQLQTDIADFGERREDLNQDLNMWDEFAKAVEARIVYFSAAGMAMLCEVLWLNGAIWTLSIALGVAGAVGMGTWGVAHFINHKLAKRQKVEALRQAERNVYCRFYRADNQRSGLSAYNAHLQQIQRQMTLEGIPTSAKYHLDRYLDAMYVYAGYYQQHQLRAAEFLDEMAKIAGPTGWALTSEHSIRAENKRFTDDMDKLLAHMNRKRSAAVESYRKLVSNLKMKVPDFVQLAEDAHPHIPEPMTPKQKQQEVLDYWRYVRTVRLKELRGPDRDY